MKRYYGIIITVVLVLVVLIVLNAAGTVTLDRPDEDEYSPIRSTYNTGATGARAFYQLLEESGYQVARWRESYKDLNLSGSNAKDAALVVVGPFPFSLDFDDDETTELQKWIAQGGKLLLVSRTPQTLFRHSGISSNTREKTYELKDAKPADLIAPNNDILISQPTPLTRKVRGLALSKLATRLTFRAPSEELKPVANDTTKEEEPPPQLATPAPVVKPTVQDDNPLPPPPPPPKPIAPAPKQTTETDNEEEDLPGIPGAVIAPEEVAELTAPVVHLGDNAGAVLVDFSYGKGRVIFLSDPFVIANNGIAQGANVILALNVIDALGGTQQKIFFDEYHHGYHSQGNAMMNYFRGTPVPWIFLQLLFIAVIFFYSAGKRFARPLPMPVPDRHSPLEFVSSMASLQQAAQARDLALENIYPRFKNRICRNLGLPTSASPQTIVARLKQRSRIKESEIELLRVFSESESVLQGTRLDDQRLIDLVAAMRRISSQLR